ncbi:MAG: SDR family NAD(P)-dependent oxidoreductase [Bacteroidales bacterium]|nr:SDR family NAD(P)-dependent oxidoreductase [Bacteroidales bacterium]
MKSFKGSKILITGASSGIGAALACEFATRGASLYLAARNIARLEEVKSRCESLGAQAQVFSVDMASETSIEAFASDVTQLGLLFDVIVLNAGISQRALTFDTDIAVDRKVMETNFFGPVFLTKMLASQIRGSRPVKLAVTTSISGLFGFPLRSAYCASKHALFGFFESLETENPNVRVTFLIPGRINTPISKSALHGDGRSHDAMDQGQANGMDAAACAKVAVRAIARGRHRKLIGRGELIMVYIKKLCPWLFFKIAGRISAT